MNTPWQAVWLLAGEVAGVVAITFIIVWRLRSVVWQRTLWQASLLAICGVLLMEFAALNQAPNPRPNPESQPLLSLSVPAAVHPVVEFKKEERSASTLESAELAVAPLPVDESQPALQEVQIEPVALPAKPVFETTPISREVAAETEVKPIFPLALALAIGVWLIGACVLAGRLLLGRALLLRFCSRSQLVADAALVKRVQGIALKLGLGQKIQVLETERIHTPVVFGLFRRGIALPKGFAQRFAHEEQEAILAHELAHLSARDPLWYLLADTLVSLLWWHPLVWLARARLHVTSEMAADEACVLSENGPETLAQCLVSIAQEISPSGALESIGIEGSGFRSRLGQRVERLLKLSAEMVSRPAAWRTRMVKIGMPVLLVGVMVINSGWMRRDEANALNELPGMTWATLRTAIEIPPENNAKRERVPQLGIKPVELAQNTQSIDQRDKASGSDQNPKVPVKIYKIVIQGEKKELNLATLRKLDEIIVPELFMDGLPLGPAVEFLMAESKKLDPAKIGLKITWEGNVPFSPNQDQKVLLDPLGNPIVPATALESQLDRPLEEVRILVNPELKKLNFGQVLDVICAAAGWPLQYRIQDGVIVITAKPKPIKGASPAHQTNSTKQITPQRQRILQKLDQVVIKELFFDGRTLPEVVLFLREESEKKDPEKIGVNFIINSNLDDQPKGANALLGAETNKIGLEQMTVKVNPPLKNLTMAQALEVIVQVATPIDGYGLQVEVNDYAVVFRAELKKTPQMFTRAYKIDEKVFVKELESRVGDKVALMATNSTVSGSTNVSLGVANGTNSNRLTEKLQAMARMYFVEQGVNLSTNGPGQAATQIFYNDRTGVLLVRAGLVDLEIIQAALKNLGAIEKVLPTPNSLGASTIVEKNEVTKLVEEGKRLYEAKKLEEAETKLKETITRDPANQAAYYYLNLVQTALYGDAAKKQDAEQRTRIVDVEKAWVIPAKRDGLPVPNPYVRTNTAKVMTPQRQRILQKLDQIVIKELFFDGQPLNEVVRFLREESENQDPEKKGINFIINSNLLKESGSTNSVNLKLDDVLITVKPALKGKTMVQCLDAVVRGAQSVDGYSIQYRVNDFGVTIYPTPKPIYLVTQLFELDRDEVLKMFGGTKANLVVGKDNSRDAADSLFRFVMNIGNNGVTNKPKSNDRLCIYIESKGHLVVRAPSQDLEVIRENLKERLPKVVLVGVDLPVAIPRPVDPEANHAGDKPSEFSNGSNRVEKGEQNLSPEKAKAYRLLEEGRRLRATGKLAEAEANFKEAIRLDLMDKQVMSALEEVQEVIMLNLYRKLYAEQELRLSASSVTNKIGKLPPPSPYVRPLVTMAPSKTKLRIEEMLDKVVLKELYFDGLPLSKAARFLEEESAKQDPEKRGINFIINSNLDDQPGRSTTANTNKTDLENAIVTIKPPMKNLTMREALTAITSLTAAGGTNVMQFSVSDFGVVFKPYLSQAPQMFVRAYKVEPVSFAKGLKKVAANSGLTNITTSTNMQEMTREFLRHIGLQTSTTNTATSTQIFYNDINGMLLLRGSLNDLEVFQNALGVLNMGQAQVQIEAKYIEVPDKVAKELGLTWFTASTLQGTNKTKANTFLNPTIPTNQNVRIEAPVLPNHVSVLSPQQTKALLQKFNVQAGVDILSSPRVTTVNNRQAQIQVADNLTVVVGKQMNPITSTNGQSDVQTLFKTSQVLTGPTLDVVPTVSSDGYSLQLAWTVCLTEFLGYDKPPKGVEKNMPLPRFRVRQVANMNALRDGQTLLLGCGMVESTVQEKVPEGRLFRVSAKTEKKHIIVLLTPRIIDPAGNPVNRDEELGY